MLIVMREIIPKLPIKEKFDLVDQLRRASKALPRLIAEGLRRGIKNLDSKNISMTPWQKVMKWL